MKDTLNSGETVVDRILRRKGIDSIVGTIADFHGIYDRDRSHFHASWNPTLRDAIQSENEEKIRKVILGMLQDASEISAYGYNDIESIVDALTESGKATYESYKRLVFKSKLDGNDNVVYGW